MSKNFYRVDVRDSQGEHDMIEVQANSQEQAVNTARGEVGQARMYSTPTAELLPSCEFSYDFFGLSLTVNARQDYLGRIIISEIKHTASGEIFECPSHLHYRKFGTAINQGIEDDMRIEAMGLMERES